jgi:AraC-like DNA-binding protein
VNPIDYLLHGALIGVALMTIGPFWRARRDNPAGWLGVGLFSAVAAFAGLRAAVALDARIAWIALLSAVAASGPYWFWLMTRTLFEDGFRRMPWRWAVLGALIALALARLAPGAAWAGLALRALAVAIVLHALWITLRGARDDLIEARLRARAPAMLVAGALALLTLARPALMNAAPRLAEMLERAAPLIDIALIVVGARLFFRVERELWPPRRPRPEPAAEAADPDAADLARLDALMTQDKVWREPGLSVAELASRARLPEYRLRRLVLERRGARNFSAFLSEYRLAEAAARLADPGQARTPITTIAYDSGFASLGPFNRAFREKFGVTPTLYRGGQRAGGLLNP